MTKPAHNSKRLDSGHLWTASWRAAIAAEPAVQPVRISVGRPRWIDPARASAFPAMKGLAPYGLLGKSMPLEEFTARYLDRLDRHADEIARDLAALRATTDLPLLLACFEARPEDCHRGTFAEWWERRTGEGIAEWVPPREEPDQMTLAVAVDSLPGSSR